MTLLVVTAGFLSEMLTIRCACLPLPPQAQQAPASRGRLQWLRDTRHRLLGGRDKGKGDSKRGEHKRTALEAMFDSPIPEGNEAEEAGGAPAPAPGAQVPAKPSDGGGGGGGSGVGNASTDGASSVAASSGSAAAAEVAAERGAVAAEPASDEELGGDGASTGIAQVPSVQGATDSTGGRSDASDGGDAASSGPRSLASGASDGGSDVGSSRRDSEAEAAGGSVAASASGAEDEEAAAVAATPANLDARTRARSSSEDPSTPQPSAGPP